MKNNLLIGILGGDKSGKSHTWNEMFGHEVRTGKYTRRFYFDEDEFVEVFLINRSASKRKMEVEDIISNENPRIVLCSLQYSPDVVHHLDYFVEHDYFLYIQWLNPGFSDEFDYPLFYGSEIINRMMAHESVVSVRSGKEEATDRINEIENFIYAWARSKDLIGKKNKKQDNIEFTIE